MLVNHTGEACLCDFGVTRFAEIQSVASTQSGGVAGSTRWKAHEILSYSDETSGRPTFTTDIYSFGMTILEVYKVLP